MTCDKRNSCARNYFAELVPMEDGDGLLALRALPQNRVLGVSSHSEQLAMLVAIACTAGW